MSPRKVCPQCGAVYGAESRFCSVDGATLVLEQPADDLVGSIVADRYHIIERIGLGGMGQVFLAEHVRMKRKSALKVMREALTSDPIAVSRFHREAENASQINHPNVAAVYDFGETSDGLVYIAMEYIPGEPLSDVLEEEGALNPARVADIIAQASDALSAAHGLGILHRDLKPDNIMLGSTRWGTDLVKLVDFGISRAMASATQQFTSTGMIVGTPDYMSPEQLTGDALDNRSDQYALGLIAYCALTGTLPFPGGASKDALLTRLTSAPRKLADVKPDVMWPDALQATLDRALALDVNERYAEVHEFGRDFDAAVAEMPGTDTMEQYRAALRQRFTTPTRAPSVTPPRAMPSLERTPVSPVPSLEREPVAAKVPDDPPASSEAPGPALGSSRARRPSLAGRLTAIGASLVLVAIVVWKFAFAREESGSPITFVPDSSNPAPTTTPAEAALAAHALAPSLSLTLDSTASLARGGVFAVHSEGRQGSAFLVDSNGIVLTSAEFVRDGVEPRIQLDAERRVVGRVIDTLRGVAALRIPIQHCRRCPTLTLATDSAKRIAAGDSLIVPAAVTRGAASVETRGAVTGVAGRRVQTTLQLSERASGAPVLAADGGVVGLAVRRGRGQPNLIAAEALAALRAAAVRKRTQVTPNDTLFPTWPATPVARSEINAGRMRTDAQLEPYQTSGNGFAVLVMTPQVMAWRSEKIKVAIEGARVMSLSDTQTVRVVDPVQHWREWGAYLGERRAVVVLHVTPELARYGALGRAVTDLKRGVADIRLYRDGVLVTPIEDASIPSVVNVAAYRSANFTVYAAGIGVYRPRDFALKAEGRFPEMRLEIVDARTSRSVNIVLPEAALTSVQRDLASYQR